MRPSPSPAYLLYAFSLLARGSDAVRLEIFGLDPAGILSYLREVAPGALPWVEGAAGLFEGVERIHLSLDLGEEILPRIGIEGSFSRLPGREPRWGRAVRTAGEPGPVRSRETGCRPGLGGSELLDRPGAWPVEAIGPGGFCFRKPSHVKVVCRPGPGAGGQGLSALRVSPCLASLRSQRQRDGQLPRDPLGLLREPRDPQLHESPVGLGELHGRLAAVLACMGEEREIEAGLRHLEGHLESSGIRPAPPAAAPPPPRDAPAAGRSVPAPSAPARPRTGTGPRGSPPGPPAPPPRRRSGGTRGDTHRRGRRRTSPGAAACRSAPSARPIPPAPRSPAARSPFSSQA